MLFVNIRPVFLQWFSTSNKAYIELLLYWYCIISTLFTLSLLLWPCSTNDLPHEGSDAGELTDAVISAEIPTPDLGTRGVNDLNKP